MSLPLLVVLFGAMVIIALLTDLPPWMVAVGAVLAVIGYVLERRRD